MAYFDSSACRHLQSAGEYPMSEARAGRSMAPQLTGGKPMTFKSILTAGFTAALIGTSSLSGTPAMAQDTAPLTAETVTDAHITSFVRAAILLEDLRRDYTTRIAGATDDEARAALAEEADKTAME